MKGCILEAILEGQGWQATLFTNLLVLSWGLRYFWRRGNITKRMRWNTRLRLLCKLCIGVSRKFYLHFTLMFEITYGAKFIQKLTPHFKNHMRNLDNFRQAVESLKSWSLMGYFCPKKYIPSAKTYTDNLSNITVSYLCENSPNSLSFLKPWVIFHETTTLYFFSSNITYFLQK